MAVDKLTPNDSRVSHHNVDLNGLNYHYYQALPEGDGVPVATIVLVHGFPDMGFGWRYQVPMLTKLGLRVIVPDMLGYGQTASPDSAEYMTYKRASDDIAALAKHLGCEKIILGGHDWGGLIVYRCAEYHPDLITAVFSVCTPYIAPLPVHIPLEQVVQRLPNFKYQIQLAGPEVEEKVVGKEKIRKLLSGFYGGEGPNGEVPFRTTEGIFFEHLDKVGPSPLVSEDEIDFYAENYARNGMHGPLNWYRGREFNYKFDLQLVERRKASGSPYAIECPVLFITAKRDSALLPSMSVGMEQHFKSLQRDEVDATHWALWEKPAEINEKVGAFLESILKGDKRANL